MGKSDLPVLREKQHHYSAKRDHTDKYVYIRQLQEKCIDWSLNVVTEVDLERGQPHDFERYYVIYYARQGCPLTNMKHGDLKIAAEIQRQIADLSIQSVENVRDDRIRAEYLAKSKAFLIKAQRDEKERKAALRRANKELFQTRKENLELILKAVDKIDFSIYVEKDDLFDDDNYLRIKRHLPGWTGRIEERLGLPLRWMDVQQKTLPVTVQLDWLIKRKEESRRLQAAQNIEIEKETKRRILELQILRRDILRWWLFVMQSGKPEKAPIYPLVSPESEDWQSIEKINLKDAFPMFDWEWFRALREFYSKSKWDAVLPPPVTHRTGFYELGYGLTQFQYNRKMCLLWFCFRHGGLEKFATLINKPVDAIQPYISFGKSKPISNELARAIENRFKLSSGELNINREFFFTHKPPDPKLYSGSSWDDDPWDDYD